MPLRTGGYPHLHYAFPDTVPFRHCGISTTRTLLPRHAAACTASRGRIGALAPRLGLRRYRPDATPCPILPVLTFRARVLTVLPDAPAPRFSEWRCCGIVSVIATYIPLPPPCRCRTPLPCRPIPPPACIVRPTFTAPAPHTHAAAPTQRRPH